MTEEAKKRMEEFINKNFPLGKMKDFTKIMVLQTACEMGYRAGMQDPDSVKNHPVVKDLLDAIKLLKRHMDYIKLDPTLGRETLALIGEVETKWQELVRESCPEK